MKLDNALTLLIAFAQSPESRSSFQQALAPVLDEIDFRNEKQTNLFLKAADLFSHRPFAYEAMAAVLDYWAEPNDFQKKAAAKIKEMVSDDKKRNPLETLVTLQSILDQHDDFGPSNNLLGQEILSIASDLQKKHPVRMLHHAWFVYRKFETPHTFKDEVAFACLTLCEDSFSAAPKQPNPAAHLAFAVMADIMKDYTPETKTGQKITKTLKAIKAKMGEETKLSSDDLKLAAELFIRLRKEIGSKSDWFVHIENIMMEEPSRSSTVGVKKALPQPSR